MLSSVAMKRSWITYSETPPESPMTFWVRDRSPPVLVPVKGYPLFHVEYDGMEFQFATLGELDVCVETLGRKLLPSGEKLRLDSVGPNSHWLSRLPGFVTPWSFRERAIAYLGKARAEFEWETCPRPRGGAAPPG
jgi:hypothetical protein